MTRFHEPKADMSKIVESLKRLNVENGATSTEQDNEKTCEKGELTLAMEETVSHDQKYILSVCGTQRQILRFLMEQFMSNLRGKKYMTLSLLYFLSSVYSSNNAYFIFNNFGY